MSHMPKPATVARCGLGALLLGVTLAAAACEREERPFRESPAGSDPVSTVRVSGLQPGPAVITTGTSYPYQENAYAVSEGQRLFNWYNCSGCHANGGGGMGPALIDEDWIYGSAPQNIYATIMQGRPNGMPSFAGRIPNSQVWQIVAYVRSLGGLTSSNVRSSRGEEMMHNPTAGNLQETPRAKQSFRPPASEMP